MKLTRIFGGVFAVALLVAAVSLYFVHTARASDHQDSPTVINNPMEDITDLYLFPAPDKAGNEVFVVDFYPLIQPSQISNITFDPTVLYQIKIAGNFASSPQENMVIQMKANTASTNPVFSLYGPGKPNEVGTNNTLLAYAGDFPFNKPTTFPNGIQVFVGPRHDPFFFDLAQFFKILPDRDYHNHQSGSVPAATATSFNFANSSQPVLDVTGSSYGTAGALGCAIAQPNDLLQPYDVESFVISVPKSLLVPAGQTPGEIGVWATTATPSGS